MIRRYSLLFLTCMGFSALYCVAAIALIPTEWSEVVQSNDAFAYHVGTRILIARLAAVVLFFLGGIFALLKPKYTKNFLIIVCLWSWAAFLDDSIVYQKNIIEPLKTSGILLLMLRPLYLISVSWMLIEETLIRKNH